MPAGYPDFSWFVRTVRMLMVVAIAVLCGAVIGGYTVYAINSVLTERPGVEMHAEGGSGKQTSGINQASPQAPAPATMRRTDPAGSEPESTPPAQAPAQQRQGLQQTAQGAASGAEQATAPQSVTAQPAQATPPESNVSRQAAESPVPLQADPPAAQTPASEPQKSADRPVTAPSAQQEAKRMPEGRSHADVAHGADHTVHAASPDSGESAEEPAAAETGSPRAAPATAANRAASTAVRSTKEVKRRTAMKRQPPAPAQQPPIQDANAAHPVPRDRPVYDYYYDGNRYTDHSAYADRYSKGGDWGRYGDASGRSDDRMRRTILPPQPRAPFFDGFFDRGDY